MRESLKHLDKYRIEENPMTVELISRTDDYLGSFAIAMPEMTNGKFKAIVSVNKDDGWEHISVSGWTAERKPNIKELEHIQNLFFTEAETKNIMLEISPVCYHIWLNKFDPTKRRTPVFNNVMVWLAGLIEEHNKKNRSEK